MVGRISGLRRQRSALESGEVPFALCASAPEYSLAKLLPRHPQLDDHPLLPFVIDQKVAMEENAAVFLKVRARDGFAAGVLGIERRRPQDDVLAVERAVALANRHRRLPRVVPYRSEAIRLGIEAGDSGTGSSQKIKSGLPCVGVSLKPALRADARLIHGVETTASVDQQCRPSHVIGGVGTKKDHSIGHAFRGLKIA